MYRGRTNKSSPDILLIGEKRMKNKGFSLVEIIIVIAIMAILSAALAPALIKYINRSRLSADVDTGSEIAGAIMRAVTNDDAFQAAVEHPTTPYPLNSMDGARFKEEVFKPFACDSIYGKAKKDAHGDAIPSNEYYYTLDASKNRVEVFYGDKTSDYMVYPTLGKKLEY
ncbi:MAG: prepilin-type N-terminal cleavage/methylation domain-containing protein [Lachnospiraceae bacterium]|jgi:type IV pilus assembly protein PilA|nr:prepilin-type N-terminal cleavage/methylation domain-containing protein [Lachnospiraceae bacterium]